MKYSSYLSIFALTLLFGVTFSAHSSANSDSINGQGPKTDMRGASSKPRYSFAQIGQFKLDDNAVAIHSNAEKYSGELDELPFFLGGIQQIHAGSWLRFGWEAGAMMSWQNDTVALYGNANEVHVKMDNAFFMFGTFAGALFDIPIANIARIFVSAGPSLSFASLKLKAKDDDIQVNPQNIYLINESEQKFGLGAYASAGIVFSPEKNYEIGLVVRQSYLGFDFKNSQSQFIYEGQQLMLSFGARL